MNRLCVLIMIGMISTGFVVASPVSAQEHASKGGHSETTHHSDAKKHCKMPCKMKGHKTSKTEHQSGAHKMHLFTEDWHDTLTQDQKIDIDKMHTQLMKESAPIKAEIKLKKIELAVLATQDQPDTEAIHKKIDEILDLKRQKMLKRFGHIVEMRHMLSSEQRLSYDAHIIGRAAQQKK